MTDTYDSASLADVPPDITEAPSREPDRSDVGRANNWIDQGWSHLRSELRIRGEAIGDLLEGIKRAKPHPIFAPGRRSAYHHALGRALALRGQMECPLNGGSLTKQLWETYRPEKKLPQS